ncbi:hypothetical protein GGS20DRAFT_576678 [Poronia punctata]|nr:hypothetical protein GGS20DRAFT_576678 [Poronia punctata]
MTAVRAEVKFREAAIKRVIGTSCTFSLVSESFGNASRNAFFHKACAYLPGADELYTTSELLQSSSSSGLPVILISKLSFGRATDSSSPRMDLGTGAPSPCPVAGVEWMKLRPPPDMPMPSGAIPYKNGILYCSQGTLDPVGGGLYYMPQGKRPIPIIKNYLGKPFNSLQSVVEDKFGSLWFTDSCAGHEYGIRPSPQLPNLVYWYHPMTGALRIVEDGLKRPGGIALGPGQNTLYITDTEAAHPGNDKASTSAATIYAYDLSYGLSGSPLLTNRRVFSFAFSGVPAAVVCDPHGNVYAACGDGVEVWNSEGIPLGIIGIPEGCSSLCFGHKGELFLGGGRNLWQVQLNGSVFWGG